MEEECGTSAVEPVILGGKVPSDNMKAFLRLPLKFRTPPKIEKIDHKVIVESRAVKQRWRLRAQNTYENEAHEEYRDRKEEEADSREPVQGNSVDFTRVRTTQLPSNCAIM